jgi:hypothetical protein
MSLISQISLSEFKRLKSSEIKEMKSVEVTADGEVLFYAIIPPYRGGMTINDNIRTQAEYLAHRSNSVGGLEPRDLLREKVVSADI